VDEIYKILHFNNADPNLYTIQFWADHFKITPASMRNMVNYIAYPLTDPETKQVTKILTFIDSELQNQMSQDLLPELNRETYFKYLETDYSKRMVEEHKDELGHFGRVGPTLALTEAEQKAGNLGEFLNNQVTAMIEDNSILEDIDAEISEITQS